MKKDQSKYYVSLHERTFFPLIQNADKKESRHARRTSFILLFATDIILADAF